MIRRLLGIGGTLLVLGGAWEALATPLQDPASSMAPAAPPALGAEDEPAAAPLPAAEQQAAYDRIVTSLMSPFCPGRTLAACPTSSAAELRRQVRTWLAEGRAESWIVERFVAEWGEDMRGAPRFQGIGRAAWIAVPVVLLLGAGLVVAFVRRAGKAPADAAVASTADPEIPDAERHRLEGMIDRELADGGSL